MARPGSASAWLLMLLAMQAPALEPMSEQDMAQVDARDGLTVSYDGDMAMQRLSVDMDSDTAAQRNQLQLNGLSWTQTGTDPAMAVTTLDAASNGGNGYLRLVTDVDRSRFVMNGLSLGSDPGRSFGQWRSTASLISR